MPTLKTHFRIAIFSVKRRHLCTYDILISKEKTNSIETQLKEAVPRPKFVIKGGWERRALVARKVPNLGKEASSIENDYCTIESQFIEIQLTLTKNIDFASKC